MIPHILSIGLNVGNMEPAEQLQKTLRIVTQYCRPLDLAMGTGDWQGVPERYIQIKAVIPTAFVKHVAAALNQDAIDIWSAGSTHWTLIDAAGNSAAGASIAEFPVIV